MEHKYRVFLVCAAGIFVTVFDTSASIVALPTIALQFGTDLPTAQWVIIGNSLTIAALLVPMGRLSDLIGRKRIYVVGCFVFALGALFAWTAPSIQQLIAARCLVGVGSAMTQGTAMAILVANFEAEQRARMLGLQLGGVGLGAIAGPALGGFIVGAAGWRSLFAVTVVAMLLIGTAGQRVLRKRVVRPGATGPRFDVAGAVLFSGSLTAGLLSLTLGPRFGWTAPGTLAGLAVFVLASAAFIRIEKNKPNPMLDLGLFRNASFAVGTASALVVFMVMSCMRFLAPFFFQGIKGIEAAGIGMLILPGAVVTAVVAPFAGRLADRFGIRMFANAGFFITLCGLLVFTTITAGTPVFMVVIALMVFALGMSTFGAANSAGILNSVDTEHHGVAASFVNLCRNTGNVIGIAFGTAIVSIVMTRYGYEPSLSQVRVGADVGVSDAFTLGVRTVSQALLILSFAVFMLVCVWSWRTRRRHRSEV